MGAEARRARGRGESSFGFVTRLAFLIPFKVNRGRLLPRRFLLKLSSPTSSELSSLLRVVFAERLRAPSEAKEPRRCRCEANDWFISKHIY